MSSIAQKALVLAVAVFGMISIPASATPTKTSTYSFEVSGFEDGYGSATPPITSVSGSITVTYDPTTTVFSQSSGLVVHSLSFALDSPPVFDYYATSPFAGLAFGGATCGAAYVCFGTNDFEIFLYFANPSDPQFLTCSYPLASCGNFSGDNNVLVTAYTQSDSLNDVWFATVGRVTAPEPLTLSLFGAGLAGAALMRRRSTGAPKTA